MTKATIQAETVKLTLNSSDPSGAEGEICYNSTSKVPKYHNGTAWTGFSSGSDPNTQLDGSGLPTITEMGTALGSDSYFGVSENGNDNATLTFRRKFRHTSTIWFQRSAGQSLNNISAIDGFYSGGYCYYDYLDTVKDTTVNFDTTTTSGAGVGTRGAIYSRGTITGTQTVRTAINTDLTDPANFDTWGSSASFGTSYDQTSAETRFIVEKFEPTNLDEINLIIRKCIHSSPQISPQTALYYWNGSSWVNISGFYSNPGSTQLFKIFDTNTNIPNPLYLKLASGSYPPGTTSVSWVNSCNWKGKKTPQD